MVAFQDWAANRGNTKGRCVLLLFRLAHAAENGGALLKIVCLPYRLFYRLFVVWLLGIELPLKGSVGPRLRLFHGQGLVVFPQVTIGADVTLRHNTTIGAKTTAQGDVVYPHIGSSVDVGANAVIVGNLFLGSGSRVGAGAVVVKDVEPDTTVVGNPAKALGPGISVASLGQHVQYGEVDATH